MKKKLLVWSDSVSAGTGFGVVSRHVLKSLHHLFDIDQLAINYGGEFLDKNKFPYQIVPARLNDPKDPYGNKMFMQSIASGIYDYVWIMNDNFVVEQVGQQLPDLLEKMRGAGRKVPKIVYYFPVDCKVLETGSAMLKTADHVVAYCKFGEEEALKTVPDLRGKLSVINHGVDFSEFHTLSDTEVADLRAKLLKVTDPDTFVWTQVNRNSQRKDIARTILAFKKFKETVHNNSILYLHTAPRDTTINLFAAVNDLGLSPSKDVIFPKNYSSAKPFPTSVLNMFYNCGDGFITTTLGEGWGLTHLEAAASGLPVVCPNNTVFPEHLDDGKRGYMYDCKEQIWVDNSGYRPYALVDDIVDSMKTCFEDVKSGKAKEKVQLCREYLDTITWDKIGQQWVDLFKDIDSGKIQAQAKGKTLIGEVL